MRDLHDLEEHDFFTFCADALIVGGATGLIAALEHIGLWPIVRHIDPSDELAVLFPYIAGTATIGAGVTALAVRWRLPQIAIAFWACAGGVGVVVGGLRYYRKWLRLEAASHRRRGYGAGHVAGVEVYRSEFEGRSAPHRGAGGPHYHN